jgi:branched-chain amino acid transport system substrate-binding protein
MRKFIYRTAVAAVASALALGPAAAQTSGRLSNDVLRIGVLTDLGGVYADISGKGAVEAVKMAVEDFGGRMFGKTIEVIAADHQNKADIGSAKAREWFDIGGVDMINDLANSGVALAVAGLAKEKKRHVIVNNASNMGITNAQCSPYTVHYAYDAWSLANGTGRSVVENGGDTWFFLTVDFAFGIGLEQQVSDVVRASKGRVGIRWARRTSRPSCSRRRLRRPRSSVSPPPGRTRSTPSRPRMNSASRRTRSSRRCCCGSTTFTRWACPSRRACSSPTLGTGT